MLFCVDCQRGPGQRGSPCVAWSGDSGHASKCTPNRRSRVSRLWRPFRARRSPASRGGLSHRARLSGGAVRWRYEAMGGPHANLRVRAARRDRQRRGGGGVHDALAELKDGWNMQTAAERLPNGQVWAVWRLHRPGYLRIDSYFTTPSDELDPRYDKSSSVIEAWSRIPSPEESDTQWVESASGWPLMSVWITIDHPRSIARCRGGDEQSLAGGYSGAQARCLAVRPPDAPNLARLRDQTRCSMRRFCGCCS